MIIEYESVGKWISYSIARIVSSPSYGHQEVLRKYSQDPKRGSSLFKDRDHGFECYSRHGSETVFLFFVLG
jgi:hypothetical protein